MKLVITGRPGVGKSTLFNIIVSTLRENGVIVGGIIAPEVRVNGKRLGFKLVDLLTGEETWLARRDNPSPVRVGSYGVLVNEASRLIRGALSRALSEAQVVGVDEVGPMELKLPVFKPLLLRLFESNKHIILVVHYNLSDREIRARIEDARKIVLTPENREIYRKTLPLEVLRELRSI
jgi:nucleoside-triphosphatase